MQESFWWWQCSDRYIISLIPHLHTPFPPFSQSLISRTVSVDVKHHVYFLPASAFGKPWIATDDATVATDDFIFILFFYISSI